MLQFGRDYELVIANAKTGEAVVITPPLQIEFDIQKFIDNRKKINEGTIKVYNLTKETRALFESHKYPQVRLSCGYQGTEERGLIFFGQAVSVTTDLSGGDIVTTFVVGESFIQLHNIIEPLTIPAGKTVGDVVKAVVSQMQHVVVDKLHGENVKKKLLSAYPIEGTPKQVLDNLASTYRIQWRCDKNSLSTRDDGGSYQTPEMTVLQLDSSSGLIGIPAYMDKTVGKADNDGTGLQGTSFNALLNPNLTVGNLVSLSSSTTTVNGIYQVRHVKYKGNFRGTDWYMYAECDEIKKNGNT